MYLVFLISFLNFTVIQYYLLIERLPLLKTIVPQLYIFIILFLLTYPPLAIIIGYFDYRRGALPAMHVLLAKSNPFFVDLAKAIILLSEGKKDEVKELMKRWTEKL